MSGVAAILLSLLLFLLIVRWRFFQRYHKAKQIDRLAVTSVVD